MSLIKHLRAWFAPPGSLDIDAASHRALRMGLALILFFFFGVLLWAALAPLSGAVIAPGQIKIDMNRKTVQHLEGGIVRKILVRDGQRVTQGQLLLQIDGVQVDAAFGLFQRELDAELARNARLVAEQALLERVHLPEALRQRVNDAGIVEIIQREQQIFSARRNTLNEEIRLYQVQANQTRSEEQALQAQGLADEESLRLQKAELGINEKLLAENFIQKTRIISMQRSASEYASRLSLNQAELAKSRQKVAEIDLRAIAARNAYVQRAADELRDNTARVHELQSRLRPYADASQRLNITAPVAGEVVGLKFFSTGAIIGPREPILDVVPDERKLIVEARVNVQDIAHVHVGSRINVRLTALNRQLTPTVAGEVSYVSADRLSDRADLPPYYTIQATIDAAALEKIGNPELRAGMPAETYVETTSRTALQYLLDPVTAYLARTWREP